MVDIDSITPDHIDAFVAARKTELLNADTSTVYTFNVIKEGQVVGQINVQSQLATVLRQNPYIVEVTGNPVFDKSKEVTLP